MTRYVMLLLMLSPMVAAAQSQWLPFQTVKIQYDARGNRIVRKLYDPNESGSKRADEEQQHTRGEGMTAYPNPAGGEVTLQLSMADTQALDITIYNTTGQRVGATTLLPGTTTITLDLRHLPPGMYHIHATSETRKRSLTIIHQ